MRSFRATLKQVPFNLDPFELNPFKLGNLLEFAENV